MMEAIQRLEQAMQEGAVREARLQQQVQDLMNQQGQAGGPGQGQVDVGMAFQALAQSQQELLAALKKPEKRVTLVDNKGLAKPERFDGKEEQFLCWRTRVEAFVTSVFPDMQEVLDWVDEADVEVDTAAIQGAFGPTNPSVKTVDNIQDINGELFAVLQSLCEKEAFTIVRSAGKGRGLEAWRKLVKRYDPTTGGRRRAMLRAILNPSKCTKLEDLYVAIETWEEHVRQYEARKKADGTRHVLDEEIKIAVLEHICPVELERHLQLNKTRFLDYADVKGELITYLESRLGSRMKMGDASYAGNDVQPMDVGYVGGKSKGKEKGGKGSKGKSKGQGHQGKGAGAKDQRTCFNCGKTGHLKKDCWSAGGGQANKGQRPAGGKGAKGKKGGAPKGKGGKGKAMSGLEQTAEPEAEMAETGYLSLSGPVNELRNDAEAVYSGPCLEPCETCLHFRCVEMEESRHRRHSCNGCKEEAERGRVETDPVAIRRALKDTLPECFHYVVDKTICIERAYSVEKYYHEMTDPGGILRKNNPETLEAIKLSRPGGTSCGRHTSRLSPLDSWPRAPPKENVPQGPWAREVVGPLVRPTSRPGPLGRRRGRSCTGPLSRWRSRTSTQRSERRWQRSRTPRPRTM